MPNLRVIHDNAADRATIVASSTAGALGAANLQTDVKSQVHRSVGTSVSYTLTWGGFETVGGFALPAINLTASATVRGRAYDAASGGTLLADTGVVYACPGRVLSLWDWTQPLNANAFAYGGASRTSKWFPAHVAAKRLQIDVSDPGNPAGCIDCARVVAGAFWEATYNARYGLEDDSPDTSKTSRAQSGDSVTDRGPQYDTLKLQLQYMPPADRARLRQIIRANGTSRPIFVSVVPGWDDTVLEQDLQLYGKRQQAGITFDFFEAHSTTITMEGW